MKTIVSFFLLLCVNALVSSQNRCIPYLLSNENRNYEIYVADPCVEDTLKVMWRVNVAFQDSSLFHKPVVKSVVLYELCIRPIHSDIRIYLKKDDPSYFNQYIWNLCYAKACYWYQNQPYAGWLNKDLLLYDSKLYMGAVFYIVPCLPY